MTPHVLVTGIGGPIGRAVADQLVKRGAVVHGTDAREVEVPGVTTWHLPPADHSSYLPALSRLVSSVGVSLVIPTALSELPVISAGRAALGRDVEVVVAGAGPVAMTSDRLVTAMQLASRDVRVPPFAVPSEFTDARAALKAMAGPFVVRRRLPGRGGPVLRVESEHDVSWSSLTDDLMIQRYVPGAEFVPMVFRPGAKGVDRRISVLATTAAESEGRLRAVTDARVVSVGVEDVQRVAMAAVRAVGLSGPVDLLVRRDETGEPLVLDMSARLGRHLALGPEILDGVLMSHVQFAVQRLSG